MADLSTISRVLWTEFTQAAVQILAEALNQLASERHQCDFAGMKETDLNRELFIRICRITYRRKRVLLARHPRPVLERQHCWDMMPCLEMNSMPSPDDPERAPREDKRPDLQWRYQDDQEEDSARSMRTFVVECKRLRHPANGWIFNENYVRHGAVRFVAQGHLYGKDDIEGAMVGYVQAMEAGDILNEVNTAFSFAALPNLPAPVAADDSKELHQAWHDLTRGSGHSPFRLHHLWIDIRRKDDESPPLSPP